MKIKEIGEFEFINRVSRDLINRPSRVLKGIGDDTAVLRTSPNKLQLFTTDMMVEDVHFSLEFSQPKDIGKKSMAVNVSDIAAMGGTPTEGVISIGIPPETELELLEEIYAGVRESAKEFGINLVGGDTVKSNKLIINVALLGEVEEDKVIYRSGAKIGDKIYVTGALGNSAAGLELFLNPIGLGSDFSQVDLEKLKQNHVNPRPRLWEAQVLAETKLISAMNDISDGLASELHEIGGQSQVGCKIFLKDIPVGADLLCLAKKKEVNPIDWILYGGEDFELVFTVPSESEEEFSRLIETKQLKVYCIGEITPQKEGFLFVDEEGKDNPFKAKGYNHFRSE